MSSESIGNKVLGNKIFSVFIILDQLSTDQISGKVLDHLGLVSATLDRIGLVSKLDKYLPITQGVGSKVSHGQRVAAMILNGLGFIDNRLYMFPDFLENKPIQRLLGEDVEASYFNDDALGRSLDAIYDHGVTGLFSQLAFEIGSEQKLLGHTSHFDTSSLSVYGEYGPGVSEPTSQANQEAGTSTAQPPQAAKAAYGYSKDHRPDLKQFVVNLATTGAAGFPIWFESHSGNASDKKILLQAAERMQTFCASLKAAPSFLYVADSAIYESCIKESTHLRWLTRVPEKLKAAKEILSYQDDEYVWESLGKGYRGSYIETRYNGVQQRWCIVSSEPAYHREIKTLERRIDKERVAQEKALWHLSCKTFKCCEDAQKAGAEFAKILRYHRVELDCIEVKKHRNKGRPKKDEPPRTIGYKLQGTLVRDEETIELIKRRKGRFILATNELDQAQLPDAKMLEEYKHQSKTESGFRFLKDDTFEVDSIFLKKESRITALLMVMTLCLMTYSIAEHFLRGALCESGDTVPLPDNRKTSKPTLKRVFKLFHGIQVLTITLERHVQELVINLNEVTRMIVRHFGSKAMRIYEVLPP